MPDRAAGKLRARVLPGKTGRRAYATAGLVVKIAPVATSLTDFHGQHQQRRAAWVSRVNIPYLLWVAFATVLQLSITWLNRQADHSRRRRSRHGACP